MMQECRTARECTLGNSSLLSPNFYRSLGKIDGSIDKESIKVGEFGSSTTSTRWEDQEVRASSERAECGSEENRWRRRCSKRSKRNICSSSRAETFLNGYHIEKPCQSDGFQSNDGKQK
ncbi:hypothetical protein L5515_017420 [Caenorhabditis briggsae]|uniref:Uncharacterized protein n=1 Tax=Caenorhabditis briggsae TaxID=6238 RepID=A0AAE9FFB1_CAEBR|nr:hypothetical protein L5515_017420 [Caenorhabditis briggsae]